MTKTKSNKKSAAGKVLAVGSGLAAVGAGAYYLLGPDGKKHQRKMKALVAKMEKGAKKGAQAVAGVAKEYEKEIMAIANTLQAQYKNTGKKAAKNKTIKRSKKAN